MNVQTYLNYLEYTTMDANDFADDLSACEYDAAYSL
jgi:hypothetical protein